MQVCTDQLTIGGGAKQTGTFILYTDYPDGWLAESEVSWLKITHETSGNRSVIVITADSSNLNADAPRTGTINIRMGRTTAGRITKTITVTQLNTDK